jgi:hypothetical protein
MELDRGTMASIDRRMLAGLGHVERYWMVRVPVSEAVWPTWRRYCRAVGVAMGRGLAGLIANELGIVVDADTDGGPYASLKCRDGSSRVRRVSMLENAASTSGSGR